MPFSDSFVNPRLEKQYLKVVIRGSAQEIDLNTCIGNVKGKFQWGGGDFFSSTRNLSLDGSILKGELKRKNDWVKDHIDLAKRISEIGGKLTYVAHGLSLISSSGSPLTPVTSFFQDPPPTYAETKTSYSESSFIEGFKAFKSSNKLTYSSRSSSYFKYSLQDGKSLSLKGSILYAECHHTGEKELIRSELDLNAHIGIVSGKLVWGRSGFYSACTKVTLDRFILRAECDSISSFIDLSRYLHTYEGRLGVKVDINSHELSDLFSEARWMKFKITTEHDASEAFELVGGEKSAFKAAFSSLADITLKHVVTEMTQELSADASLFVRTAVSERVKEEMTKVISRKVSQQVQDEITAKIKATFAIAQKDVLEACSEMVEAAASDLTVEYTESVVGTMTEQITAQCNELVQTTLTEVSASAIAQFQERAEILMERELIGAKIRRAQTQANILKVLMEDGAAFSQVVDSNPAGYVRPGIVSMTGPGLLAA